MYANVIHEAKSLLVLIFPRFSPYCPLRMQTKTLEPLYQRLEGESFIK